MRTSSSLLSARGDVIVDHCRNRFRSLFATGFALKVAVAPVSCIMGVLGFWFFFWVSRKSSGNGNR